MAIRTASLSDEEQIRQVYLAAFPANERDLVARLAVDLLHDASIPRTLNLVEEVDDCVLGHLSFSPVRSRFEANVIGYILAPLAIAPQAQKKGIGSKLVHEGLRRLSAQDIKVVLVYGDPEFYGRFGFGAELGRSFVPPFKLQYPFGWQAMCLSNQIDHFSSQSFECVDCLRKPELW